MTTTWKISACVSLALEAGFPDLAVSRSIGRVLSFVFLSLHYFCQVNTADDIYLIRIIAWDESFILEIYLDESFTLEIYLAK